MPSWQYFYSINPHYLADSLLYTFFNAFPEYRGRQIGTQLLTGLRGEAEQSMKPIRLGVLRGSRALSLYRRLGFMEVGDDGLRMRMEWRPGSERQAC